MAIDVQPNSSDNSGVVAPNINGAPAGVPTAPTSQVGTDPNAPQSQPAAPPKETFGGGVRRGLSGRQYLIDGTGNVVEARTTSNSGSGNFGSILAGIVSGAFAGARASRPGRTPSQEIGGGFGAGVGAAIDQEQQQDVRNRTHAQQDFSNRQATQKMSREDAESAAQINHLAADTARIAQDARFTADEHPLIMAAHRLGLDEAGQRIQKNSQEILTNSLSLSQTLGEVLPPDAVSAIVTNFTDAKAHIPNIVSGKSAPLHNGETGEDSAVGMHDVQALKTMRLPKDVTYKTYTSDRDGNPIEKINTLKAGASAYDFMLAAVAGNGQLQKINSQQSLKLAADVHRAEIRDKNASAFKAIAEGKKAQAETVSMKDAISGEAEDLVEGAMDPSQLQKRGNQYAPTLAAARDYSMKKYGVPFDLAKAQEDYKFASDPKTQNRLKYMNSLVGDERTGSTGNLDLLVQYSDKVKRSQFPKLNDAAAWARLEAGDTDIVKFHNAAVDAADQFANIMAGGGSGNATSDAKIKQGLDMFNQGFTKDQVRASASSVKDMLQNRKREFIGDNRYLVKQYSSGSNTSNTSSAKVPQAGVGISRPTAATMTVKGSDGKLHWSDGKSDLGIAQ